MISAADRKPLLSTLWIFALFNYTYADLFVIIFSPEFYEIPNKMSASIVLGFAVHIEIAIAMVLLSHVLPYRANRWVNIFVGLENTLAVAWTLGKTAPPFYVFFATIEMATTLVIVWYAWTWKTSKGAH